MEANSPDTPAPRAISGTNRLNERERVDMSSYAVIFCGWDLPWHSNNRPKEHGMGGGDTRIGMKEATLFGGVAFLFG